MFYLVQRLTPRNTPTPERGFDGFFACEYMGSAEFEFGALPQSLKAMRAEPLVRDQVEITFKLPKTEGETVTRTVYLAGTKSGVQAARDSMQAWVDGGLRAKERSNFEEAVTCLDWMGRPMSQYNQTRAWWAIDENVMWSLDPEIAGVFKTALGARVVDIPLHP